MAKNVIDFTYIKSQTLTVSAQYSQCSLLAFEQLGQNLAQTRQNHGLGHKQLITLGQTVVFDPSRLNSWLCFVLSHPVKEKQFCFIYSNTSFLDECNY